MCVCGKTVCVSGQGFGVFKQSFSLHTPSSYCVAKQRVRALVIDQFAQDEARKTRKNVGRVRKGSTE